MQQLELRKLKRLLQNEVDDNILLFLLLIAHSTHDIEKTPEQQVIQPDIVSQVNYWPVLAVKPANLIDILCKPVDHRINQRKEDDALSNNSIDSGYDSFFENDVYSISYTKVTFRFYKQGHYFVSFRDRF